MEDDEQLDPPGTATTANPTTAVSDHDLDDDLDEVIPARQPVKTAIEWAAIIIGAFAAALIIKTFVFQAFYIPSASMEPTLQIRDRVLVNKLSYKLHDVNRGDLVVFERPPGSSDPSDIKDLIKRVIGLPGDTIESRDGHVVINAHELEEPYLPNGTITDNIDRQVIPDGHVFVMGDNRCCSKDSRVFGPISEDLIVGRAFVRVWPLGDFGFL